jgi:hypothetical protein
MKKLSLQINELRFINEFFDGEICLCGGIADFIYVGYDDISDIDIIVKESSFIRSMEIDYLQNNQVIKKNNFDLHQEASAFFLEQAPYRHFYGGLYKNYPIDLFVVKNIDETIMFKPKNITKKYGISVTSVEDRIIQCKTFLSTQKTSDCSELFNKWLDKKKNQAKTKLELYEKFYPEIYNDLFYI